MNNYPDGSNTKDAPWNQNDEDTTKNCEECNGFGGYKKYLFDDIEIIPCEVCNGKGYIEIEEDKGDDDKE